MPQWDTMENPEADLSAYKNVVYNQSSTSNEQGKECSLISRTIGYIVSKEWS